MKTKKIDDNDLYNDEYNIQNFNKHMGVTPNLSK